MIDKPLMAKNQYGIWHLRHGPIEIFMQIDAEERVKNQAWDYIQAIFPQILPNLAKDYPIYRHFLTKKLPKTDNIIGQKMINACAPFAKYKITPMAAVAGSVAEFICDDISNKFELSRIFVNNGGDIALFLRENQQFTIAICTNPEIDIIPAKIQINHQDKINGVATSGWRGRSFSLGIADAVSVLASTASRADAAATIIANHVNIPDKNIVRVPANTLNPDSDLKNMLITQFVPILSENQVQIALERGLKIAQDFKNQGLITDAFLALQNRILTTANNKSVYTNLRQELEIILDSELVY